MESKISSPKNININSVLQDCIVKLNNSSYLPHIKQQDDWLLKNCTGNIKESLFQELITNAKKQYLLSEVVAQLIDYASEFDITDKIFNLLMSFSSKKRDMFIVPLSHKRLSEQQLLVLCNYGKTFEPYYELAIIYYTNDTFTDEKLKSFLQMFKASKYGYLYEDLLQELLCKSSNNQSKKIYLLDELNRIS